MGWKRVAWAGCLVPAVGGCSVGAHAVHDAAAETRAARGGRGADRAIRQAAREAWREVADQHARQAFTAEFRDGFLDGYADYLDRGGDGQPPAAPPARYAHNPKYLSPEGHALVRHYFLGFRYGAEVAVASGRRQFFTVPVLIPDDGGSVVESAPVVVPPPAATTTTPPVSTAPKGAEPLPAPRPLPDPTLPGWAGPKPAEPGAKPDPRPFTKPAAPGSLASRPKPPAVPEVGPPKFMRLPSLEHDTADAARELPPPLPLIPAPAQPVPVGTGAKLPPPPAEFPAVPPGAPLPVLDPLPPLPPNDAEVVPRLPSDPDRPVGGPAPK